jgi:hypothetical protein
MFWIGFLVGVAVCLAIGLAGHLIRGWRAERRQRAAFIASLSPSEREALRGFEMVNSDWRTFRELSPPVLP